jgi:diguanylate cyclase (GGDEF)-like protein
VNEVAQHATSVFRTSRFRIYQVVLAAALLTYGIDFVFGLFLGASRLELTLWPVMMAVIGFILWHMAHSGRLSRRGEITGYIVLTANAFSEFLLGLFTRSDLAVVLLNVGIWLLVLYVFAFFVFEARQGLYVSLAVSLISLLLALLSVVVRGLTSASDLYTLLKFYCATFFVITFGYAAALWREQVEKARSDVEAAQHLALTDGLTGVYNRRGLDLLLEKEANRAERYERDLSMIVFDLDHFKSINDTYGHSTGDEVLKTIADLVQSQLRKGDELGRWGGEEFMVICSETDVGQACLVADRLREVIANHDWQGMKVTASFGIARRQPGELLGSLFGRADAALYQAKQAGRNCTKVATPKDALTAEGAFLE